MNLTEHHIFSNLTIVFSKSKDFQKLIMKPGMMVHAFIPITQKAGQVNLCVFGAGCLLTITVASGCGVHLDPHESITI